jgi:hypothetical protein
VAIIGVRARKYRYIFWHQDKPRGGNQFYTYDHLNYLPIKLSSYLSNSGVLISCVSIYVDKDYIAHKFEMIAG